MESDNSDTYELEDQELLEDLRLEMKIKNNILWKKIHEKFPSVAALCRANEGLGMYPTQVGKLLAFKTSPFYYRRVGKEKTYVREYRKLCLVLEQALNYPAEILFPEELCQKFVGTQTSKAIQLNSFSALPSPEKQKILFLPAPDNVSHELELSEMKEKIEDVLNTLTKREKEIVKLRYGIPDGVIYTAEELFKIFKVSRSRIFQIETKAIWKLQQSSRLKKLESLL